MKISDYIDFRYRLGSTLFLLALPLTYFPRYINGDTQIWPFIAGILGVLILHSAKFISSQTLLLLVVCIFAILSYWAREGISESSIRFTYKIFLFIVLWLLIPNIPDFILIKGLKITLLIWFAIAIIQYLSHKIGSPIAFYGRFVPGRSGVPSITPEPSVFGSISGLILVYLISIPGKNISLKYLAIGGSSLFLSGSLLAIAIFGIAFTGIVLLRPTSKTIILMILGAIAFYILSVSGVQIFQRLETVADRNFLLDPSINLRVGHLMYTLYETPLNSLFFLNELNFQENYNEWAITSQIFIATGSDFILPTLGGLIYEGGFFGLIILLFILHKSFTSVVGLNNKIFKISLVFFILLNPIGFSNTFFLIYVFQGAKR